MGSSPLVSWVTEEKRQNMFFTEYCICGLWRTVNLSNSTVVLEATFCQESSKDKYKSIKYKVLHCNNQHFIQIFNYQKKSHNRVKLQLFQLLQLLLSSISHHKHSVCIMELFCLVSSSFSFRTPRLHFLITSDSHYNHVNR